MSNRTFTGTVLFDGQASGPVLWLDEPLSFWGGFDPATGTIIDVNHPQRGERLAGRVVVLPATRGSGGTPGGLAEALRNGAGPAAIVVGRVETNLMVGAAVAARLYDRRCPVIAVSEQVREDLRGAAAITLGSGGSITARTT